MTDPINKEQASSQSFAVSKVPDDSTISGFRIGIVIIGVAITIPAFLAGSEMGQALGLEKAIQAFILAGFLIAIISSVTGGIGAETRLSTAMILQFTFGRMAAKWAVCVLAVSLLGWFGITVSVFSQAMQTILLQDFNISVPEYITTCTGGILMTITTVYGFRALDKLSVIAVPLLFIFLLFAVNKALDMSSWELLNKSNGKLSMLTVVSLMVGAFMSLAGMMPDLCRYARNYQQAIIASVLGFLIGYPLVLTLASIPGLATNSNDFVTIMFSIGLGVSALFILVFASWTTNANNLYSASLVLTSISPGLKYRNVTIVAGIIGTVLGLIGIIEQFIPFLFLLGTVISPICGIYSADYFLVKDKTGYYDVERLNELSSINWLAVLSWIMGSTVSGLSNANVITLTSISTVDAILVAFCLYFFLGKYWLKRTM